MAVMLLLLASGLLGLAFRSQLKARPRLVKALWIGGGTLLVAGLIGTSILNYELDEPNRNARARLEAEDAENERLRAARPWLEVSVTALLAAYQEGAIAADLKFGNATFTKVQGLAVTGRVAEVAKSTAGDPIIRLQGDNAASTLSLEATISGPETVGERELRVSKIATGTVVRLHCKSNESQSFKVVYLSACSIQ